jgi:hypothetical protein
MTRRQRRTNATRRQQPAPLFVFWTLCSKDGGWELIERQDGPGLVAVGRGTRYSISWEAIDACTRLAATHPNAAASLRAVRWHARQA